MRCNKRVKKAQLKWDGGSRVRHRCNVQQSDGGVEGAAETGDAVEEKSWHSKRKTEKFLRILRDIAHLFITG